MAVGSTVAIVGATGVVGSRALTLLLESAATSHVSVLGRRPPPLTHPKLTAAVVDLLNVHAVTAALPDDLTVAICCLGTTMKQAGSHAAFRAVDHDAVMTFAQAARRRGASHFLIVSSLGADPRGRSFYLRVKGQVEQALQALAFPHLTVLRPSFIDDEGTRPERRRDERLLLPVARAVFAVVGRSRRFAPVPARVIAQALVRLAHEPPSEPVRIVESEELQRIGRSAT